MFDCLGKVVAKDGVRGIYRGILLSIPVAIVFRATYFGMYDTAKEMIPKDTLGSHKSLIITFCIAQVRILSITPHLTQGLNLGSAQNSGIDFEPCSCDF